MKGEAHHCTQALYISLPPIYPHLSYLKVHCAKRQAVALTSTPAIAPSHAAAPPPPPPLAVPVSSNHHPPHVRETSSQWKGGKLTLTTSFITCTHIPPHTHTASYAPRPPRVTKAAHCCSVIRVVGSVQRTGGSFGASCDRSRFPVEGVRRHTVLNARKK